MPYCTREDVHLFVPNAPSGETFSGYITHADRVIDAKLRTVFTVPFSSTPDLVVNVSSKLAAAEYLKAKHASVNQDAPQYAADLYDEAMKVLTEIVEDPQLLDIEVRDPTSEDFDDNEVSIAQNRPEESWFRSTDERTWGRL